MDRLKDVIAEKGLKLFAMIDHSAEAAAHGLELSPDGKSLYVTVKGGAGLPFGQVIRIDLKTHTIAKTQNSGNIVVPEGLVVH